MSLQGSKLKLALRFNSIILLIALSPVYAQELEPRAYTNLPVGLNFIVAGYAYAAGGVLFDPSIPLENANINIHGSVLAYARSIKIGGISGKVDMVLPFAWLSGTADFQDEAVSRKVSGFGDPRLRFTVNFLGAPAVSMSEFKDYKQKLIVGASLQVNLPLSQYDADRLVNIGTNRFTIKPEIGVSRKFGHLILEITGGASFYTVNHDFYQGKTRSQESISYLQGHVVYSFRGGIWAALDGTYYWGGRTTLDGVERNDLQQNSRLGFTFALPLNLHHSLKLHFSTGTSTRTGSDFDSIGFAWQYRWVRKRKIFKNEAN
jgi:hypothetical protein